MNKARTIFRYIVIFLSVLIILASLLSLIHDLPLWYSKVLDFPRLQYLIGAVILLIIFVVLNRRWNTASILLCAGLAGTIAIHGTRVLPYLIGEKTVPDSVANSEGHTVGIMLANVLIKNRNSAELLEIVNSRDPDMFMAMEVDQWWMDALGPLAEKYPHRMAHPTENAYGMVLYSRFPLEDRETMFLNHEDVPSFHADVVLPSGRSFRFHGIHPVAPVPSDKFPDNVGEKEVALIKVGAMVAKSSEPAIVAGDLNDVSWSYTARLFSKEGELENVRLGRGLYSSFNANSWIWRWPLDHYFVTQEFGILELERLPAFGSDHFPMYARFVLEER